MASSVPRIPFAILVFLLGIVCGVLLARHWTDVNEPRTVQSALTSSVHRAIYQDCETRTCKTIRAHQLQLLLDELQQGTEHDTTISLRQLPNWLLSHVSWDDVAKEIWVQDFAQIVAEEFAQGFATTELDPDQGISPDELVTLLRATVLRYEDS